MKLLIELCIHLFRYQRRLTWMLSSLLQQEGDDLPNIIINISHTDDDGNPTTKEVCDFFRNKGLNIVETMVTKEEVPNRAIARNRQTIETKADFILYADADMVYDKLFFDDLHKKLKTNLKDVDKVMGADRISLNAEFCIKYFEEDKREYPCVIENAADICSKFPVKWVTGKNTAAGNFQLANVGIIKQKAGGVYVTRLKDFWRNTKSDRMFRIRMGGRFGIDTKPQYHLNHSRGGPEQQR